jgi:hypothetical protein
MAYKDEASMQATMCDGKVVYESKADARRASGNLRDRRPPKTPLRVHGLETKPYKCMFCAGWHVGHQKRT